MQVENQLERIRTCLLNDFENDAIEVIYNYNPINRTLFCGVNYPLSELYIVYNWIVPEENLGDFFNFIYGTIAKDLTNFIKKTAKEYGY